MDSKKIKLSLNKETIANLNNNSMALVNGGATCSAGGYTACPASEPITYCRAARDSDCNSVCGTSCNNTACYTWCDCESIATGFCC